MRRAQMHPILIITIVALVILGIGVLFAKEYSRFLEELGAKAACEASVNARAAIVEKAGILPVPKEMLPPLRCVTERIEIKEKDEEKIKKRIADALYDCWKMLGRGQKNFLGEVLLGETHCIICATIDFDKEVQKEIPKIKGLGEYLSKKKTKDLTYWQFLTNDPDAIVASEEMDHDLPTNERYAIVFAFYPQPTLLELLIVGFPTCGMLGAAGAKYGAAIGAIAGGPGAPITAGIGFVIGAAGGCVVGAFSGMAAARKAEDFIGLADYFAMWKLVPYRAEIIEEMGCRHIESI